MGVGVADYDCDGWFDIFKANFADDTCNLYHNNAEGTFTDFAFSSGLGINNQYVAWGCGFFDFDNDSWQDILQVNGHVYPEIEGHDIAQTFKNPRLVYTNNGEGRFKDVSSEMIPGISKHFSSCGAAFGNYENDGDIDVFVLNMNDRPSHRCWQQVELDQDETGRHSLQPHGHRDTRPRRDGEASSNGRSPQRHKCHVAV